MIVVADEICKFVVLTLDGVAAGDRRALFVCANISFWSTTWMKSNG